MTQPSRRGSSAKHKQQEIWWVPLEPCMKHGSPLIGIYNVRRDRRLPCHECWESDGFSPHMCTVTVPQSLSAAAFNPCAEMEPLEVENFRSQEIEWREHGGWGRTLVWVKQ